jgi:rhodanese-related sulfurtransferase
MSFLKTVRSLFTPAPSAEPAACFEDLRRGKAVLVDVREHTEWEAGVAKGAKLLPMSDLRGPRSLWTPFLREASGRRIIVHCAAGVRAGTVAKLLVSEGHDAVAAGGLGQWQAAGWEIVKPR